ncbi:MAG: hypothetical protein U0802_05275 [Candidatus Binatia bacterium]
MPCTPTIAVDLAKSAFEVACSDRPGRVRRLVTASPAPSSSPLAATTRPPPW